MCSTKSHTGPHDWFDDVKRDIRKLESDISKNLDYFAKSHTRSQSTSPRHQRQVRLKSHRIYDDDDLDDRITPRNLSIAMDMSGSTEDTFQAKVDLWGYSPSDVKVTVQDGEVSVSGEQEETYSDNHGKTQYSYKSFSNNFTLPADVDEKSLSYSFQHDNTLMFEAPRFRYSTEGSSL